MDDSEITYFSFYFSGNIDKTRDIESIRFDLFESIPERRSIIEKIVPSEELEIGQNLDFENIVNLIKAFRKSGAGYKVKFSTGKNKNKELETEIKIDKDLMELELEIEKSKVIVREVAAELGTSDELKDELDNIRDQQRGKIGKKYIMLNVKLNEVWEKQRKIVQKLLKRRRDDLLNHMKALKSQTEKIKSKLSENRREKELIEDAYSILQEGDRLLSRINSTADSAGFVPETGDPKGCFIATAVYGEDSIEVDFLRKWRDTELKNNLFGRIFIRTYYFISPSLSVLIKRENHLRNITKYILNKVINKLGSGLK